MSMSLAPAHQSPSAADPITNAARTTSPPSARYRVVISSTSCGRFTAPTVATAGAR
jgi:hypothetical protein